MGKEVQLNTSLEVLSSGKNNQDKLKVNHRYRLVQFKNKSYSTLNPVQNSKCTLKIHKAGLLLSGNFSKHCSDISVLAEEVQSIQLVKGKETIDTFFLSPMHILMKIGLPNSVSRHFRFHPTEYKITQTKIRIDANDKQLELISSGYRFEKLRRSFKKMGFGAKLKIERKPSVDYSDFKDVIPNARNIFY